MRREGGEDGTAVVVVVVNDTLFKVVEAEVANADHAILAETGALDNVASTARAKDLTADAAVVFSAPRREHTLAVVTFFRVFIVHPVVA